MAYFLAVRGLVAVVPGFPDTRAARITFAALFTLTHAAISRWLSVELVGVDYPWYLQAGVAAQYLLGPGIQPSAFGVLLVFAVAAFAHGRPVLACTLAAGACWFHSTYLLPSGLLVCGFLVELTRQRRARTALVSAGVAIVAVVPVIAYTFWRFDPLDPDAAQALHILARVRIPHHCVVTRWFDLIAGLQLAWVALGLVLLGGTALRLPLLIATTAGVLLTAYQHETGSDRLALAFPWRISVLLVPVATATVLAKVIVWKPPGKWGERGALVGLFALVAGGVVVTACGLGYRSVDEHELYDHIRATAKPEHVYLLPVQFPAVGSGRGAVSNTFAPPARAKPGANQIPVDLQRFRLATGARVYVDFKSVPYAAAEVEEWRRRMIWATDFYAKSVRDYQHYHDWMKREGITHVVVPRASGVFASYLEEVYADDEYIVYRVK